MSGFLPHVTKCTADTSWFVKKAAVNLISKIILSSKCNSSTPATYSGGAQTDEEEKVITTVFAPIMTDGVRDVNQLSVCLEILENRDVPCLIFSCLRLDKMQIVERLCALLRCLPSCSSCDSEMRILEILAAVCESYDFWNEARQELVLLTKTLLLHDDKILSAVAVAAWLLKRFVTAYHTV